MKIADHNEINSNILKDIEDTRTIIFALKESIKLAETQKEYDIYIEEIAFREQELKELQYCLMQ